MYAPTAAGASRPRPVRARAKITNRSPRVATTSDRKCAPLARCLVDQLTAAPANIRLATTAPLIQPPTCAGRYARASRHLRPPNAASTNDTTGLRWAPDTGPNIKMMAKSPAAVAEAFSKSSSPMSEGDRCWAAMPEPMTTAARKAEPRNSALRRRQSGCSTMRCSTASRGPVSTHRFGAAAHGFAGGGRPQLAVRHLRVGQDRVDLPGLSVWPIDPHLVLDRIATGDLVLHRRREAFAGQTALGVGDVICRRNLDAQVVE